MSAYNAQPLALEEPSEGRTTAKAFREAARSQSPQGALRQSATLKSSAYNSPQTNSYGQTDYGNLPIKSGATSLVRSSNQQYPFSSTFASSGNNDVTVDTLLQKVDDLLKQSQTPAKQHMNLQARAEVPTYNQPNSLNQASNSTGNLRRSMTPENGKPRNEIFVKKNYDNILRNSQTLMANPLKDLQTLRPSEKSNEIFPIRESLKTSTLSTGGTKYPGKPLNLANDMGDIRSRISNLENQLNGVGSPKHNSSTHNDQYATPRSQSIPPLKSESLFPSSVQQETLKRSPYGGPDYLGYSVERPKNQISYGETNPKRDAEVSEQICQTIDHLIQTHLFNNRSPTKSTVLTQRSYYTSPSKKLFDPSSTSPLYKSNVIINTEPVHKSTPLDTYQNTYDSSSTYKPYSTYDNVPKYEPLPAYEPFKSYEFRPTYEPLPPYESQLAYEPLTSYEPRSNYERESRSSPYYSTDYLQRPLNVDYDGAYTTRPRYVRPLYRNSPSRYATQSNWSNSGIDNLSSKYVSPGSHNYYNKHSNSGLSTPIRENPSNQDTNSTDKKMKKLTLKSKISEEKDNERAELPKHTPVKKESKRPLFKSSELMSDHEGHELPLPIAQKYSASGKNIHKNSKETPSSVPEKSVNNKNKTRNHSNYRAGDLLPDTDHNAGELLEDNTPRAGDAIGELVDDSECEECEEREVDLQQEREKEREKVRQKVQEYEREKERERVREQEKEKQRQKLRQSQKINRNVPDDGKAWNMVHKVPSFVFDDEENSFNFDAKTPKQRQNIESGTKQAVRVGNPVKTKPALEQSQKQSGRAMIWAMDDTINSNQRKSISDLSDSIRRSQRKPALTHCFEKSDRLGY